MSEYCREWAQNNHNSIHDRIVVDHLVDHAFDHDHPEPYTPLMTAHKPPRPPSPGVLSQVPSIRVPPPTDSDDDDDDDDGLSLNSSDLGASWQAVERSESGTSVSGSISALGSAAVSDLEPSSDSEHDWNSDFDSEGPTLRHIPHVAQQDQSDSDDDSVVGDTPSPYDSFQRSFIFPDPNSSSFSSSKNDDDPTPVPSIVGITAKDLKTPSASLFESALDGRKTQRVTLDEAPALASASAGPSRAQKPFPAGPTPPKRGQLTALVSVFAFALLFLKLGPAAVNLDISSLIASTFTPPGPLDIAPHVTTTAAPPTRWLGADLQVVRDALSVFNTAEQGTTVESPSSPSQPEQAIAEATSTAYRWFRSEYRWSREDESKPITDVIAVSSSSLITTGHQIVTSWNDSYDTMGNVFQGSIQLVSEYVSWSLQNLAAFVAFSVDALRKEVESDIRQMRAMAEALYNPEHVQAIFNRAAAGAAAGAASSHQVFQSSLQRASRMSSRLSSRMCANDRCSPTRAREVAARAFSEAHQRGQDSLKQARRGLSNVIHVVHDAVDKATSEAQRQYVSETDCLRDRDSQKSCRRNKRSAKKEGGCRNKDKRNKKHKRETEVQGHSHKTKCSVTDRLVRRCGAGVARG